MDAMTDALALYRALTRSSDALGPQQAFDRHVAASMLSMAADEAARGEGEFLDGVGLDGADFWLLADNLFPGHGFLFRYVSPDDEIDRSDDETCLCDLLLRFSTSGSPFEKLLSQMIARRAQRPNHLWQDLGLKNRDELSRLMATHFKPLKTRNSADMKWKKFLYRMICRDSGYALCTAPVCAECADFNNCFGDESGESLMAALRR